MATEAVAMRLQAAYKHRPSAGRLPRDERRMETRTGFESDGWMGRARGGRETSAVAAAGTDIWFRFERRKGSGRCEEAMVTEFRFGFGAAWHSRHGLNCGRVSVLFHELCGAALAPPSAYAAAPLPPPCSSTPPPRAQPASARPFRIRFLCRKAAFEPSLSLSRIIRSASTCVAFAPDNQNQDHVVQHLHVLVQSVQRRL